jgi:uncharacterized protein (TIGR02118 family)
MTNEDTSMIKHISLISRHDGESVESFREYWKNTHSQIIKSAVPHLRKYLANFPLAKEGKGAFSDGNYLTCDAVIEMHFDSVEDLQAAMTSEGWFSERRQKSSARLIDLPRVEFMIAEEVIVVDEISK